MKNWAILLGPLLLAFVAILFTLRGFEPSDQVPGLGESTRPRYLLKDAEWTRFDAQGRPQLRAQAREIDYFDDRSAQLRDVQVDRLGGTDGPWRITSPLGLVPASEQRISLKKPVTVRGALQGGGPIEMATTSLWIDFTRREIYTDDPVRLTGPNRSARARGMRADWAGTRVQLLREVEIEYARPG